MRLLALLAPLLTALVGFSGPLAAQDPVEFGRLSTDQRQLAEQVRRLEKILETLEQREREEGAETRADLLKQAREKLTQGAAADRPLASLLEEVAADLAELRAGSALEQQAELIRFLEELLDFLLETERREQVQDLMEAARAREQQLRELAQRQAELREQTEALRAREAETGQVDAQAREDLARAQEELNEDIRAAAEDDPNATGAERAAAAAEQAERAEDELNEAAGRDGERSPGEREAGENEAGDREAGEKPAGEREGDENAADEGARGEDESREGEGGENEAGERESGENEAGEQPEAGEPSESGEQPEGERPEGEQPGEQGEQPPPEGGEPPRPGERPPGQQPGQQQPGQQQSGQQPPPSQRPPLEQAEDYQRRAEEELERAAEEAQDEADRLEGVDELERLINVLAKCEELLARHQRVLRDLGGLVEQLDGETRVPRSARVDLRQWATEQRNLATEADELLFEIREAGADSYPFMLRGLVDDHTLLAKRIGPPRYRAESRGVELGARIERDWERLIEAIRIEAERIREQVEGEQDRQGDGQQPPPGGNEPSPPQPLVSMAAEVQLLKLMQGDLRDRMQGLRQRRALLAEAGIELDQDDLAELEALVERQKRLRTLFENILARLREESGEPAGEEI